MPSDRLRPDAPAPELEVFSAPKPDIQTDSPPACGPNLNWFGAGVQNPFNHRPAVHRLFQPGLDLGHWHLAFLRLFLIVNQEIDTMARGTVKWFNSQKGYGFIQPQAGGKDVFVHISAVEKAGLSSLNEGQVVEYEEVPNKGKTSAENLKVQR